MFELVLFLKMKVFLMFSVCLTVEGVFYPTGSLIHVVFLSPLGPSWASSAVCVCENVCVHPSYLPAEARVCVYPFKTHADQLQPSMIHPPPTGGHLTCGF